MLQYCSSFTMHSYEMNCLMSFLHETVFPVIEFYRTTFIHPHISSGAATNIIQCEKSHSKVIIVEIDRRLVISIHVRCLI